MTRPAAQELFTLALHHTAFGSGERDVLAMGSRSPEEAAQWRTALLRARDRALELAQVPPAESPVAAPEAGELSPSSAPASESPRVSESGGGATPRAAGLPPATSLLSSTSGKIRSSTRANIGHVPPELRDVQEVARRAPAPLAGGNKAFGEEGVLSDDEGPSVLPGPEQGATWRLCALENGLRFFEDGAGTAGSGWAAAPVTKVAGRCRAPSDVIFKLLMDLGRSREEWDCTFASGRVVEVLDGHTEVVHVLLRPLRLLSAALPSRPRDLVMTRYWRREEDGTYVILLRSTEHVSCPERRGVVRAEVACGCYIITPLPPTGDAGEAGASGDCLVMHLLETSPRGWMLPFTGLPRAFQRALLMNVAGIRDFFEQLSEKGAAHIETGLADPLRDLLDASDDEAEGEDEDEAARGSFSGVDSPAADGTATPAAEAQAQAAAPVAAAAASPPATPAPQSTSPTGRRANASPGSGPSPGALVRQPTIYLPAPVFTGLPPDGGGSCPYGPWPPAKGQRGVNCWSIPPGNRFVVRSSTYLTNGVKCPAGTTLMTLIAVDWLVAEVDRIDNICGRPGGALRRNILPAAEPDTHVFCVNLQVPGAKPYSIIFYFASHGPPPRDSCLGRFWYGDDAYRAPRFKLIPAITEGAWVVQRSVGTKPLIVGNALKTTYYGGGESRFLEVDVDIGSSSVANSVTRFVMAYLRTLVIDLAFVVEAKTEAELPERLMGTIRVAHLDPDLAHQAPAPA
jgi:hypothetical protein